MSDAVSPDKLTKEGKSAYQNGNYLAAAQAFEAAQQGYLSQDDKLNAAELAKIARSLTCRLAKDRLR
jgi:hypothetical protein